MKPGFELDIPALQEAIAPWMPGNPDKDAFVRPNQETVQLYLQLKNHGFECAITPLCLRPASKFSQDGKFNLLIYLEYRGTEFDARDSEPYALVQAYCAQHEVACAFGDNMDQAIGRKVMDNYLLNADKVPNPGLYRAIEAALSQMQRDRIDADTQPAISGGKAGGRL